MNAGRMALIQDPTGAMVAAWEPHEHPGANRVNDPGCLTWNELATGDIEAATAFYSGLFGWDVEELDTGGGRPYSIIRNNGRSNGGITTPHGDAPPHWLPYFTVSSTDESAERAVGLGGQTLAGPLAVPQGRIAALRDPQGAAFALFEGEVDD